LVQGYMPNEWRDRSRGRRAIALLYRRAYEGACRRYEHDCNHKLFGFWAGNFSLRRADCLRGRMATPVAGLLRGHEDQEFGLRCLRAGLTGVFDRSPESRAPLRP